MENLTPRRIVEELDKYIVGQAQAKKAVAIALRNRHRRLALSGEMQEDIIPKNILMIGPTGVGKTEIARRLARLVNAPFIKVEATKFTEVGYVGRDVDSIIRDLVEVSIRMVRSERTSSVDERARLHGEERLLDVLCPLPVKEKPVVNPFAALFGAPHSPEPTDNAAFESRLAAARARRREVREQLTRGELEELMAIAQKQLVHGAGTGRRPQRIYKMAGRPCPRCRHRVKSRGQGLDNRTTYWCPNCQK